MTEPLSPLTPQEVIAQLQGLELWIRGAAIMNALDSLETHRRENPEFAHLVDTLAQQFGNNPGIVVLALAEPSKIEISPNGTGVRFKR